MSVNSDSTGGIIIPNKSTIAEEIEVPYRRNGRESRGTAIDGRGWDRDDKNARHGDKDGELGGPENVLGEERTRRTYEYKITMMQSRIVGPEHDLGAKGNGRISGSKGRRCDIEKELAGLRQVSSMGFSGYTGGVLIFFNVFVSMQKIKV